jgi:hypothetical protein
MIAEVCRTESYRKRQTEMEAKWRKA